jgi:hypothetical protein
VDLVAARVDLVVVRAPPEVVARAVVAVAAAVVGRVAPAVVACADCPDRAVAVDRSGAKRVVPDFAMAAPLGWALVVAASGCFVAIDWSFYLLVSSLKNVSKEKKIDVKVLPFLQTIEKKM